MDCRQHSKAVAFLSGVVLLLASAHGSAVTYLAAGMSQAYVESSTIEDFEPRGLRLRAGIRFSRHLDVELG